MMKYKRKTRYKFICIFNIQADNFENRKNGELNFIFLLKWTGNTRHIIH